MTLKRIPVSFSLLVILSTLLLNAGHVSGAPLQPQEITFAAEELLGRPTDTSITINVVPDEDIELYYEYGTSPGAYTAQTPTMPATGGQPHEIVIGGLQPNTRYYYRMQYHTPGNGWVARDEHSFWTQRASGGTFTFTVIADSHVNIEPGVPELYAQTLLNVADDNPEFHLDLGDTFAMDQVTTVAGAEQAYLLQRDYMGVISHSAPIFLAIGNHEQEEGWHLDDTGDPVTSKPVLGTNARKKYYPNPVPDGFYSGNMDTYFALDGDQLHEDYYAWEWGDALFIVLDPFWYTTTKPFLYNIGGGEKSDEGSGDRWDWTLGLEQFNWFKQTIENSNARYKFVFAHHMVGGSIDYVRGGAGPAHLMEWGGYGEDGTTWEFDARRPGWGGVPIHQLMIDFDVSAFFHGHDHQYAYEERDGIVYHSLPGAGITGNGFNIYSEADPYTIKVLPNSGHLRITVSPEVATVEYVRSDTTVGGINGQVSHTYTIEPLAVPSIFVTGTPLASFSSATGEPSAEQSYTVAGIDLVADIELTAPADFEISTTSGSGFGPSLTLPQSGGSVPLTTIYVRFHRTSEGTSGGEITHTSSGATTRTVAVSGTANPPLPCYSLILGHTGNGSDPVADPANSGGCPPGEYLEAENITLSGALPDSGWEIGGWTGTDDDGGTASTNTLTMPASAHAVSVNYTEIPSGPVSYMGDIGSGAIKDGGNDLLAISTTTAVAAGDDIVVVYATDPAEGLQVSVTDSAGNSYVEAGQADRAGHLRTAIFVAYNVTALPSGSTISITQGNYASTAPIARAAVASVFRGLADADALDRTSTGDGDSASTPSSGIPGMTRDGDELLIGAVGTEGPDEDASGTWDHAFNAGPRVGTIGEADDSNITASLGWRIVTATGEYTAQKSDTTPRDWAAAIATFMTKPVCTVTPPQAVAVAITHEGSDVILSWQDSSANTGGYQVHRSTDPYFLPDESTRLGDPLPVGSAGYTDVGAAGTAGTSYTYIVQALNCDSSQTAESASKSIFNLSLVPGSL